ncbi:sporulation protein YqfD [Salipaludibacillus aurantiacus]|uniref:Similar to stage IV sporulation protein n=1 Tax=Salipaludibacillus aurantiacus TaxID=1601833 RepID=A0A1H9RCW9_9BACI|nr:sporulation protein YqfD [Salipaludibacillus aurantiacus]SER70508.1 similar to stage IV sporulation protein [Salipaludibacillus aurantiacus]
MRNEWVHRAAGYMKIRVSGTTAESFINECTERGVIIWGVQFETDSMFTANVMLADLSKLKKLAKHFPCKIYFIEKRGAPFILKRITKRKGMLAGLAAFIFALILLSNMVWSITIDGAEPHLEYELRSAISDMGVKKGKLHYFLPPPEKIQENIMNELDKVTWVGVTKQGSALHFQVVEREIVEEKQRSGPAHLVAARKAVIHDLFVEKGKPMVEPNQFVKKGEILVSGLIGKEDNYKRVAAEGRVRGESWYKVNVKVPLNLAVETVTGEIQRKHALKLWDMRIPFWGFKGLKSDNIYEDTLVKKWEPFGFRLPLAYEIRNQYDLLEVEERRAKEKAAAIAKEEAVKTLLQRFSEEAEIIDEKVLHQTVEGGKVKVLLHFRVIDDIAVKQPVIQGD